MTCNGSAERYWCVDMDATIISAANPLPLAIDLLNLNYGYAMSMLREAHIFKTLRYFLTQHMHVGAKLMVNRQQTPVITIPNWEEPHAVVTNPDLLGLLGSRWACIRVTIIFGTTGLNRSSP